MKGGLNHAAQTTHERQYTITGEIFAERELNGVDATSAVELGELPFVGCVENARDASGNRRMTALFQFARIAPVKFFSEQPQVLEYLALMGLGNPVHVGFRELVRMEAARTARGHAARSRAG